MILIQVDKELSLLISVGAEKSIVMQQLLFFVGELDIEKKTGKFGIL